MLPSVWLLVESVDESDAILRRSWVNVNTLAYNETDLQTGKLISIRDTHQNARQVKIIRMCDNENFAREQNLIMECNIVSVENAIIDCLRDIRRLKSLTCPIHHNTSRTVIRDSLNENILKLQFFVKEQRRINKIIKLPRHEVDEVEKDMKFLEIVTDNLLSQLHNTNYEAVGAEEVTENDDEEQSNGREQQNSQSVLATHSLTVKQFPSFMDRPAKKILNPQLVDDILYTVSTKCRISKKKIVRNSITTKCTDKSKLYNNGQKDKQARSRK
ncbi:hypothetical protein PYW07_005254 [Mythimna separata]|uniref:BEN domain-containing protein n=1 Tax=Mythimna separata TaxID=271217 RepID=A0AAD7YEX8_MYTSE|nr:hypothetical protein PYW07_005254 [Mythimna separata]